MKRLIVEPPLAFEEAAEWATDAELAAARGFAPARGREYLAWRAIVRREIGRDAVIAYNSAGAPMLTNYPLHLSVSHCRGRAGRSGRADDCRQQADGSERISSLGRIAVAISDAPCAVDIEPVTRDFQRAMPRYLSPSEHQLSVHPLFPAIAWCAKETLFKYAGSAADGLATSRNDAAPADGRTLDLLRDLHIDSVQFPDGTPCGTLSARIRNQEPVVLHFYEHEGFAVVSLFE
ncbi:MAG: 4'-phosphopantetheinyl transferase superfamily protein [Alistipes senegalensis]|nr:4'-phosphopantetheinyl transferase superfamily protein [Bacteroides cellulosilyticus]MCM1353000.1 4'-phosphopantetheinyl transferase superfamily protein [Alistipes senegalensis]